MDKIKPRKLKWRKRRITIIVSIPICPDCGADMEESPEGRKHNVFSYKCTKCDCLY